ncbi:guanine nucleotide-binding protein G(T) subunit gamma-T1-like, partial [Marmota marmota marmota]|uniref:guanine nucleotide-binding protein G(T) subunit gamma-T1-like n=1 Tax=Marmota marmota marmota TaxID=9994 RepID=UPI0007624FE1
YSVLYHISCLFLLPLKVSKCCEAVRDYVEERSGEDPLVKGIPEDKNPFKELKGGCVIS